MNARTASLKSALAAVTVFVLCAAAAADIIYLNTGGVVKGQILDEDEDRVIIKTTCGEIPVNRDNIDFIEKGTDREILEQRLAKINKTSTDSYFDLGLWAQSVGLEKEALELFRRAIELEPDNVFARQELGHRKHQGKWLTRDEYNAAIGLVKYAGEWVTKEDAEKLKAGYIRYGDEWLKKEDLEMARKGFRKLDGKWVNEEEYYKAKGFVRYGNKWVTQAEHEKFKKQDEERARQEKSLQLSKQIKGSFKVRCSFEPDAQKSHLERFGEMVKKSSEFIWDMTGGGVYIEEAQIYDRSGDGDVVVRNLDQNKCTLNGRTAYGWTSGGRIYVGGACLVITFVHEFGHAKFGLPDHYGTQLVCIMNAGEGAKYMKFTYCDSCWQKVEGRCPGLKRPQSIGQDFGEPPETRIVIKDN